ncbi:MAG TPA: carboxypeptidase-like regulatory domain-containing protein, partial [Streptosporangiaceae bacterium]
ASVTGRVTLGSSSGKPLAGMCVYASNADGSVQTQTATGPHGYYRVIGLAGGDYQLQIGPGCSNIGNYTSVALSAHTTAGKQTSGVNAVLQPGATISGTVTDRKGRPVPGICIELNQSAGPNGAFGSFGNATAADGSYVVNQLSAGTYEIGFFTGCGNSTNYAPYWYDNQSDPSQATPIVLATGASQTANAKLQPGAAIAGTVTDASGHGLAGICVSAATRFQAQLGFVFTAQGQTGTHGRYTIPGLAPGQYLLDFGCGQDSRYADQWFDGAATAGSADLVSAPVGRTAGINAVLEPAGFISGVVTGNSGQPLAGVCVSTVSTKDSSFQLGGIIGGNQPITNSHGSYLVTGLAPGSYDVLFQPCSGPSRYAEQWYRQHGSTSFQTAVRVRSGKRASGIDARLTIGGTISGHAFGAAGNPLRNVCVFAFDPVTSYSGSATTGRSGAYTVPALPSGTYMVDFFPCGNQNLIPVLSSAKVTAPHAVTGLNGTLRHGGSISGIVTAAGSGSPVADVCVDVFSSDPNNLGGFAVTNPDGTYQATGLPTGAYQVLFDATCPFGANKFVPQWYNNQSTQATANPVGVTAGHITPSIDAALQPGATAGQITGTVSSPASAPLAGVCVTAVPASSDLAGSPRVIAVSRTGGYTLTDLMPGNYDVEFSSGCGASGYVHQWWQDASSQTAATPVTVGLDQVVSGISATMSN